MVGKEIASKVRYTGEDARAERDLEIQTGLWWTNGGGKRRQRLHVAFKYTAKSLAWARIILLLKG